MPKWTELIAIVQAGPIPTRTDDEIAAPGRDVEIPEGPDGRLSQSSRSGDVHGSDAPAIRTIAADPFIN